MMNKEVHIFADLEALSRAAAERFIRLAELAIAERGCFHVALTGGSTPRRMYEYLASDRYMNHVVWPSVYIYFGDERCVPPDHPDSNFRMAHEALLRHVPIPSLQVHRMQGEQNPAEAAAAYAQLLDSQLPKSARDMPRFDLVLLGLGEDGHIASLFPGTVGLTIQDQFAVANFVEKLSTWRISLTFPVINAGTVIMMLVAGAAKADIVNRIMGEDGQAPRLPAQRIVPAGILEWYLDGAAARLTEHHTS